MQSPRAEPLVDRQCPAGVAIRVLRAVPFQDGPSQRLRVLAGLQLNRGEWCADVAAGLGIMTELRDFSRPSMTLYQPEMASLASKRGSPYIDFHSVITKHSLS